VSFGLGYIWAIAAANERCAEFNRQPNAGRQTYGIDEQFILASCVAALGLLLAVFALARQGGQAKGARP
jgi:hypothetical protein